MSIPEEEINESRREIESRIMAFFDSFTVFIYAIVDGVLEQLKQGKLTKDEAYELLLTQLMETYQTKDEVVNKQIELYLTEIYQLGLQSIGQSTKLTAQDIALLYVLFKGVKRYIGRAEKDYAIKSIKSIEKLAYGGEIDVFSRSEFVSRFNKIIITEGTKAFNVAIIALAERQDFMLKFKTQEDEKVCPQCIFFNDKIYNPIDAWWVSPVHVQCRCYFLLVEV